MEAANSVAGNPVPKPAISKGVVIGSWIARIVVAGIFVIGAIPKFTGQAGALADVLPGGYPVVIAIGLAEVAALGLILNPATALYGAVLASLLMLGAVGSHVIGPVGFKGDAGSMFPLALLALAAAVTAVMLLLKQRCQSEPIKQTEA